MPETFDPLFDAFYAGFCNGLLKDDSPQIREAKQRRLDEVVRPKMRAEWDRTKAEIAAQPVRVVSS